MRCCVPAHTSTRWLYCVEWPQHSIRLEAHSTICAQAVYFLHSTRPSVTWLNSRWWLATCDLMSVTCRVVNPHPTWPKNFGVRSVYGVYWTGEWLWIDSSHKNENYRHPVEGWLAVNFRQSIISAEYMDAWSRKTLKCFGEIFAFLEKRPLTVNFSKVCSKRFHRLTDRCVVFKVREIWADGKSVKSCVA